MRKLTISIVSFTLALAWISGAQAAGKFDKATPELIAKGKAAYAINCATCHGDKGAGDGVAASALNPKPRNFIKDKFKNGDAPAKIFDTITKGLPGTTMAPFGHLSEEDRWGITHFILDLKKGGK